MNQIKLKRDPEGTRRRILAAAGEEFAQGGLSGARVDQIARRAETNERMLYYYFGSKEQLFIAVLEQAMSSFADAERALDFESLEPADAVIKLAHFVWDYYYQHQELLSLLNNENLHEARYLKQSKRVPTMISPMLTLLGNVLERGAQAGQFRPGIDAARFYTTVSALGYYVLSNRYTLEATLGRDFGTEQERSEMVRLATDMLLAYLRPPSPPGTPATPSA